MNVFLTGGTGFVGSHTAEVLLARGHRVRAFVRPSSSLQWLEKLDVEIARGSLHDPDSLKHALQGIDAVVHIAGVVAAKSKEAFYEGNQGATHGLLQACATHAPNLQRFVLISSQTAGGPSLDGTPVTEETPPHPITTYGKSKLAAEEDTKHFHEYFPVTILRLPAIYGPRDTATLSFFQSIKRGLKPLIGFENKFVNLCFVADIAAGIELGMTRQEAANRTYYIGSKQNYSWHELSSAAAEVMQRNGIFVRIPHSVVNIIAGASEFASIFRKKPSVLNWEKRLDLTQQYWTCSIDRAVRELGYEPQVGIKQGFAETIRWYEQAKWM
ncbi:MAG: NAD-dependent epimerase/dehydratase family protein [Bacteroidetes bacterium]|nr:NAD-dependent epimerase/dehydratase family protein [Bacteroidota bacterium]